MKEFKIMNMFKTKTFWIVLVVFYLLNVAMYGIVNGPFVALSEFTGVFIGSFIMLSILTFLLGAILKLYYTIRN